MVMPNVQMINQKLINYGLKDALRIEIPFRNPWNFIPGLLPASSTHDS